MACFSMTDKAFFGKEALCEAMPYIAGFGGKALIVTGRHVGRSPMMDQLKSLLAKNHLECAVFDGITGEPTDRMIREGVEVYRKESCDMIIGLGGGSPLDSAKAIAAMAVLPGNISDYIGKSIEGSLPPVVAIPTTSGTGSETTKFTVITDSVTDVKMLLRGDSLVPDLAVLNPEYCEDMPKKVTACTGLDALTHAVEAFTSVKAFPLTDTLAVSAIRRILKYLPEAFDNGYDTEAREQMLTAAFEAGVCINNSSVTLVHGMSRPIGALFHVPHGMSNAMLLDVCLRFAAQGAPERFAELAREAGVSTNESGDREACEMLLSAVSHLVHYCRIPTLKEYGISEEQFVKAISKMASDAVASGSPANTRRQVTEEDCRQMYRKVYGLSD